MLLSDNAQMWSRERGSSGKLVMCSGVIEMVEHVAIWNTDHTKSLVLWARKQALVNSPWKVYTQSLGYTVLLPKPVRTLTFRSTGTWQDNHLLSYSSLHLITKCFILSDYSITVLNCIKNCRNIAVTANGKHRLSLGKTMVKGIQTDYSF